jgi:hypothetical protein
MGISSDGARSVEDMNVRDFDYGIGDDIDCALQQLRATIAAQIRQAIGPETDPRIRNAYERAIEIAEGHSRVNLVGG